ncbi:hypothetical protein BESB_031240 [Besnoitia besnoiti]|uniref:Derlin n=1 Tax=Besnoitia besnoiti TaxID=94643 RepID=A0A2A9M771_BESBE|nr:hypothetical protein BESB_031240 [Besnoitia besnoiti]PFH31250.1 hypothetical protein BESB_031240 [Besnoitia besnoiti]
MTRATRPSLPLPCRACLCSDAHSGRVVFAFVRLVVLLTAAALLPGYADALSLTLEALASLEPRPRARASWRKNSLPLPSVPVSVERKTAGSAFGPREARQRFAASSRCDLAPHHYFSADVPRLQENAPGCLASILPRRPSVDRPLGHSSLLSPPLPSFSRSASTSIQGFPERSASLREGERPPASFFARTGACAPVRSAVFPQKASEDVKHTTADRKRRVTFLAFGNGVRLERPELPVAFLSGLLGALAWRRGRRDRGRSGEDASLAGSEPSAGDFFADDDVGGDEESVNAAAAAAEAFSSPFASFFVRQWKQTPKLTRGYLSLAAGLSLLSSCSSSRHFTPSALLFDAESLRRGRELHRLLTSLFFLGPLSLSSLLSFSFVHAYLGGLELHFQRTHSPETFRQMLGFALGCTYSLAALKQIPSDHLLQTLCTFLLYVWSRTHPGGEADVYGLCTIPNEYLPFFFLLQNWILEGKVVAADLWGVGAAGGWLLLHRLLQARKKTLAPGVRGALAARLDGGQLSKEATVQTTLGLRSPVEPVDAAQGGARPPQAPAGASLGRQRTAEGDSSLRDKGVAVDEAPAKPQFQQGRALHGRRRRW